MVFGSDETLSIVQKKCASHTKFFGFGDVKNAFIAENKHSPKYLSQICAAWNGRGCLTPVCLFVSSTHKKNFISLFFKYFTQIMNERLKLLKTTFHDHNVLFLESEFKKFDLNPKFYLYRSKWVVIVDLSTLSPVIIQQMNLDFAFGGSGFVFILPFEMKNEFSTLSFNSIFPTFADFQKELTSLNKVAFQ